MSSASSQAVLLPTGAKGLSGQEAAARFDREGPNEVPERKSHPFIRFARKFWGLSAWMIELIALLSFILGQTCGLVDRARASRHERHSELPSGAARLGGG